MKKYLYLFTCIYLLNSFTASTQTPEEELQQIFQTHNLMGMSVVAVYQGEMIYSGHFGLANFAAQTAVTSRTMYRIASISKSITATAFMKLYEQGLVGLDDNISDIMGFEIKNPSHPGIAITPRMLLSHTATLNDGSTYSSFLGATANNPNPPAIGQLIVPGGSYYSSNIWLNETPGHYFQYTNLGYGLLASIIEKVSDTRFDIFVRDSILLPVSIQGSFNIHDLESPAGLAVLYRMSCDQWVPQADNYPSGFPQPIDYSDYTPGHNGLIFAPQGGLRISAEDLSVLMSMFMNKGQYKGIRILEEETVDLMQQMQWEYNGNNGNNYWNLFNAWGLGFHLTTNQQEADIVIPGYNMVGHPGEAYGLISDMYFHNDPDFGLVFITNGSAGNYFFGWNSAFYEVEEQVFDVLYNGYILPAMSVQYFDVNIDTQGMGATDPGPGTYSFEENHEISIAAIPDPGWLFDHFLVNGVQHTDSLIEIIVDQEFDVTAVFTEIETTIGDWINPDAFEIYLSQRDNQLVVKANTFTNKKLRIHVTGMRGVSVLSEMIFNSEAGETNIFDLSQIAAGAYIVTISSPDRIITTEKILVF
ncbi:MAG: beta-lactamase family protein [Bacteroidales bacterium]|nr:beta-lactamase family protein [Bacteroidales bacterium]